MGISKVNKMKLYNAEFVFNRFSTCVTIEAEDENHAEKIAIQELKNEGISWETHGRYDITIEPVEN